MNQVVDITRTELLDLIRDRRVVIGALQGERAQITIDFGKTSQNRWVPRDWVKPMLEGRVPALQQNRSGR